MDSATGTTLFLWLVPAYVPKKKRALQGKTCVYRAPLSNRALVLAGACKSYCNNRNNSDAQSLGEESCSFLISVILRPGVCGCHGTLGFAEGLGGGERGGLVLQLSGELKAQRGQGRQRGD